MYFTFLFLILENSKKAFRKITKALAKTTSELILVFTIHFSILTN